MTARPEELVQLRDKLVADGECFNVHEANTKHPIGRGCGGPPESTGHGMQEEIRLENPGGPIGSWRRETWE